MRIPPSTRLKTIRPPSAGSIFFSSVAARSGTYLYMKMKNASEIRRLTAASQLLTVAAFSRLWEEDFCACEEFTAAGAEATAKSPGRTCSSCIMSSMATLAEKRSARKPRVIA